MQFAVQKREDIRPADGQIWLTLLGFRFTRPAFHRGRSRYFAVLQREHMSTRKIAMHKSVISHDAYNRPYDLAFRSRVIFIDGFAVGLALFQGEYSIAIISRALFLPQQCPF